MWWGTATHRAKESQVLIFSRNQQIIELDVHVVHRFRVTCGCDCVLFDVFESTWLLRDWRHWRGCTLLGIGDRALVLHLTRCLTFTFNIWPCESCEDTYSAKLLLKVLKRCIVLTFNACLNTNFTKTDALGRGVPSLMSKSKFVMHACIKWWIW